MENHPPEHHIHETLELIKKEAEANPNAPLTNMLAHRVAFLNKNCTDFAINSAKPAEKYARWAMWAAIVAAAAGIAQILVILCTS